MEKQRIISKELNAAWVGKEMKVLIEGCSSSIELNQSKVLSWEHGLMRGGKAGSSKSKARSETKALDPRESETISRARSEADAPDIDGKVYVQGALAPGRFATVKITGHGEYDLMAVPL